MEKHYTIGGKKYIQRPLVMGQIRQLARVVSTAMLPEELSVATLIVTLADQGPAAVACALRDEDGSIPWLRVELLGATPIVSADDEKFLAYTLQLANGLSPEVLIPVVEDFFDCNPIASLLERLSGIQTKIEAGMTRAKQGPGSMKSSASSPEETSPGATPSSGATPSGT